MKNVFFALLFFITLPALAEPTLDVNADVENGRFSIKETACGWVPDLSAGFIADSDGCYRTSYSLKMPLRGFVITPRAGAAKEPVQAAFYIGFYKEPAPAIKYLHADIMNKSGKTGEADTLFNQPEYQGTAILDTGEYLKLYSDGEENYYVIIFVSAAVLLGLFLIFRRRNNVTDNLYGKQNRETISGRPHKRRNKGGCRHL